MRPRLALLLLLALGACQPGGPAGPPDTLVDLATVQSGPRVQADELNGAIGRQPQNSALLARRASLRLDAGQPTAALEDVNRALALDDTDGDLYFLKARSLRALSRLDGALAAARQAAEHGFGGPELPLLEGETHLAAHHYAQALTYLDRALRLDPDQPAALFYKGLAYAASADTLQAFDYLRAALARDPRQPEILHQLAFLANAYGYPDEAGSYARRGLRLAPTSGPLHYDYGRQWELRGQLDSARRHYERALALDTTLYRADYRLALLLADRGQRPAALIGHLRRALRRNPRLPQAHGLLAEALENQGRLPEALAQYRLAVAENPGNQRWTFKAWKVGEKVRLLLPDSLRPAPTYYYRRPASPVRRPTPIAPLQATQPRF
ncbi:tetratricopeptide repeat protein [uncultured Hymenobacter sp.]|uniref:tetratricopeptide repeat protein n=1 Tax=uncultured Hymenobacter sp. TaxID=170016 RepID=UPI0035CA8D3C